MPSRKDTRAEIIGARIKQARHVRKMSQRDLADRVGVSAQAISFYERGVHKPGPEVMSTLVAALDIRLDRLLRPIRVASIEPKFRKHRSLTVKALNAIQAGAIDWLERYLTIERILFDEPKTTQWPDWRPYEVSQISDAEDAAYALRGAWGMGAHAIGNLTHILEDRFIKVGALPADPEFDACTFEVDIDGTMPVIVMGLHEQNMLKGSRQRFSLAHELGHLVTVCVSPLGPEDAEKVANRFAAALLAPRDVAVRELGERRDHIEWRELHALKHKYGLNMAAWLHRAWDLGIITQALHRRMVGQYSNHLLPDKSEPWEQYERETPERFERLVYQAYAEEIIGDGRASELLGMSRVAFRRSMGRGEYRECGSAGSGRADYAVRHGGPIPRVSSGGHVRSSPRGHGGVYAGEEAGLYATHRRQSASTDR